MFDVQLLIAGQSRPASSGATFERCNPLSETVVTRAAAATPEDAVAAIEAAAAAFPEWSRQGPRAKPGYGRKVLAVHSHTSPKRKPRLAPWCAAASHSTSLGSRRPAQRHHASAS